MYLTVDAGAVLFSCSGGTQVPGVSLGTALAPGRCMNNSDCKSDSLECSFAGNAHVSVYTCDKATGVLNTTSQGSCVKTACAFCRDCMSATVPFAMQQASVADPASIAEEWRKFCGSTGLANSTRCAAVATAISTSGSAPGNLGKRAAGLCFALGQCSATSCGGALGLDTCTVDARPLSAGGMLVPGISASSAKPDGRCFSKTDCPPPADTCDKSPASSPSKLCVCSNGEDSCSSQTLGSCIMSGSGCAMCKQVRCVVWALQHLGYLHCFGRHQLQHVPFSKSEQHCVSLLHAAHLGQPSEDMWPVLFVLQCLAEVQPFVKRVLDDATQYTTWPSFCTKMNNSSPTCGALATRFGSDVNKYRRAGVLCSAMMLCSPTLPSDPTCTFEDVQLLTGQPAGSSARFDQCPCGLSKRNSRLDLHS